MRRAALQFAAVVVFALAMAAVMLLPSRRERIAILAGDGRYKEAVALIERELADDPRNPDLLAALGRSYAALGDVARAIDAFDAYLLLHPDDVGARKQQAELFLQQGDVGRYLDALARAVAAHPSPAEVTRLVELYRLYGRRDDELATLRTYAAKAMLDPAELARLGAVLAARGDVAGARRWLELADRAAPAGASAERFLLLQVLLRDHEVDAAQQRAQAWLAAWPRPFLAGRLILAMARAGLPDRASGLARQFVDMMPDHTFEVVDVLAMHGQADVAADMLTRWADRADKPGQAQLRAFARASAAVGDLDAPLGMLARLARSDSNPAAEGQLAEELANAFGTSILSAVRPLLSNQVLLARPLFAARLSLFEGNREMARWFLDRAQPDRLSPRDADTWLALVRQVETDDEVFRRLALLWNDGRLPAQLLPSFADESLKLGHVELHSAIWNSMRQ